MSDASRSGTMEGEAPVNPYSLLEAVNRTSQAGHRAWLIFVGVTGYLLVTVGGVTHLDLLRSSDILMPILQVRLPLAAFFVAVPAIVVLGHAGLLAQLVGLAREALELDAALRMVEATDKRTHPLRLELNNFFLVQAIAGPERSRVLVVLQRAMGWMTLVLLPIAALLFVQATFLPYHDQAITWWHRGLLVADLALLVLIGVFLCGREHSLRQALVSAGRRRPLTAGGALLAVGCAAGLSFVGMTYRGESLDHVREMVSGGLFGSGARAPSAASGEPSGAGSARRGLFGLIRRDLEVTQIGDAGAGQPLNLRHRDLRGAVLDRMDLRRADLAGADLDGASLAGADLRGARLGCADAGAWSAERGRTRHCLRARGADFTQARLAGADLSRADLVGARGVGAELVGAVLAGTDLSGADLSQARLDKAKLTNGTRLKGANLTGARLTGADLTGSDMLGADLSKAILRAASLRSAGLEGVVLRHADLEGATLFQARLYGADLSGARINGTSFRQARVWLALPPDGAESRLAEFAGVRADPLSAADRQRLGDAVNASSGVRAKPAAQAALEALKSKMVGNRGGDGPVEGASWAELIRVSERASAAVTTVIGSLVPTGSVVAGAEPAPQPPVIGGLQAQLLLSDRRARLTRYLGDVACRPRAADGAFATGVARRAVEPGFEGDPGALLEALKRPDCAGGRAADPETVARLEDAVERLRGR
ncbi:MAG: pentapeptide repeat-containing protein [Hyphomicrobiaceae bacterium]